MNAKAVRQPAFLPHFYPMLKPECNFSVFRNYETRVGWFCGFAVKDLVAVSFMIQSSWWPRSHLQKNLAVSPNSIIQRSRRMTFRGMVETWRNMTLIHQLFPVRRTAFCIPKTRKPITWNRTVSSFDNCSMRHTLMTERKCCHPRYLLHFSLNPNKV